MADLKLFKMLPNGVTELEGHSMEVERSLQTLIERNMEALLGIRFLASEYSTGKEHGGRIDSLGIDENGCPVIFEYKRALNENVINQGLFYLDWLMDHQAEFTLLVLRKFGQEQSDAIEWSSPRLLCVAGDFTKYDEHAVKQINRNIELVRYRQYGNEMLLLELVNATSGQTTPSATTGTKVMYKTVSEYLEKADDQLRDRFESLRAFLLAMGDDVTMKVLKFYVAFRRMKNFACAEVHPSTGKLIVCVKVNPDTVILENGFTRDVRKIGHLSPGDLEITIGSDEDLEKAKGLLIKSYEMS